MSRTETTIRGTLVLPDRRQDANGDRMRAPLASRTLALLKAMMPKTLFGCPVEIQVHHEQARGPYQVSQDRPDFLALTFLTTGAPRAYQIACQARSQKSHQGDPILIMMGGIHATSLPLEALQYCNLVVRGEVTTGYLREQVRFLFDRGADSQQIVRMPDSTSRLKSVEQPVPDWSWLQPKQYFISSITQSSMGCPFECDFCSVTEVFGAAMRTLDYGCFEREIAALPQGRLVGIVDDNFLQGISDRHIQHCLTVANLLHQYGHRWVTEVTVRTLIDAQARLRRQGSRLDLIEYFAAHGARGFFFGIETVSKDGAGLHKSKDLDQMRELIRHCQDCGLGILGAFVLGVGKDENRDYYKRILEFAIEKVQLDFLQCSINTPMPGARNFLEAVRDNSILNWDWALYDAEHCVIRHPILSPSELEEAHCQVYREFYGLSSITRRTIWPLLISPRTWKRQLAALPINLALRHNTINWNHRRGNLPSKLIVERPDPLVLQQVYLAINQNPAKPADLFRLGKAERDQAQLEKPIEQLI